MRRNSVAVLVLAAAGGVPAIAQVGGHDRRVTYNSTTMTVSRGWGPGAGPGFVHGLSNVQFIFGPVIENPGGTSAAAFKQTHGQWRNNYTDRMSHSMSNRTWAVSHVRYRGTFEDFFGGTIQHTKQQSVYMRGITNAKGWYRDPFAYTIGDVGSGIDFFHAMDSGTSFQSLASFHDREAGAPGITIRGRLGIGTQFSESDPFSLWPSNLDTPSGAADLFQIHVHESGGAVAATVDFLDLPGTLGLAHEFIGFASASEAADAMRQAIVSAPWTLDSGMWTLGSDVEVFSLALTNLVTRAAGDDNLVIGVYSEIVASVPVPGSVAVLIAGGLFAAPRRRQAARANPA